MHGGLVVVPALCTASGDFPPPAASAISTRMSEAVRVIDPEQLPKHFEAAEVEARLHERWDRLAVYAHDPARSRAETFVVDTPPPTVSGSLHVGHVFSYTHADVLARHRRMQGLNVFYPMGWDDNGLPTERRVQNHFHVRCDPRAPLEPGLRLEPATAAQAKGPPRLVSRPNFIELCLELTRQDEEAFKTLWRRIGLSVDWSLEYSTIDPRCRHLAQLSFRDLFEKGYVYSVEAPTMWDVDFQTAVAQAEVEDRPTRGAFHDLAFAVEGGGEFVIATTRPELLAACVGVTAHPDDPRYRHLFGRRAVTPLFGVPVPIFPSALVDREKGTGILMVCTFGDATDVVWWREERLPLRQILGRDGRLVPVTFGSGAFPSLDPEAANQRYAAIARKGVGGARQALVEMLREPGADGAAPLRGEPKPIEHSVKFFEKGDRPLEFMSTRQWFVRLLDQKDELLASGDRIRWHPDFMRLRFRNWTENLNVDWCVSRQRYFGVPFPVWYPLDGEGRPDHAHPIVAAAATMPVDPTVDLPPGYGAEQRDRPGGFTAEADVFDTWFTSSLTPQIGSGWRLDPERHAALFPADIRPQSHEIIRTWAFYTIAKALLHEHTIPWQHVVISGWILDPDRKKMSKSKGNVVTPMHLLDEYTSDGVRYWAASARLGTDTAFDEKVLKVGKRLVTKLYNAGKFVLAAGRTAGGDRRRAGPCLRASTARAGRPGVEVVRRVRLRPRAAGHRVVLLARLHRHLSGAGEAPRPRSGRRLGDRRPAARPGDAAPALRAGAPVRDRRGLVVGVRRGDRAREHSPGPVAAFRGFRSDTGPDGSGVFRRGRRLPGGDQQGQVRGRCVPGPRGSAAGVGRVARQLAPPRSGARRLVGGGARRAA